MKKFFKSLSFGKSRSKERKKEVEARRFGVRQQPPLHLTPPHSDVTLRLPRALLERIFHYVCPHSQDNSYESCEQSAIEYVCMLCDLRDLAHCTMTCQRWRQIALRILYYSIRIDAVHYCEREDYLAEQRKSRSFFNHNAEPENTAQARLRLLCRTLREDASGLGLLVRFFKTPYMTRETCKADLARTVAVLPKVRYVDLPEGFFSNDPTCHSLKQEVQARCPDIRKMSYISGAESSFENLTSGIIWSNLEVLELSKLNVDYETQRHVFARLQNLRALKLTSVATEDNLLLPRPGLPPFPALVELLLEDCKNISIDGLIALFSTDKHAVSALRTLSITMCSFSVSRLYEVLALAPNLKKLSIIEEASTRFSSSPVPLLTSHSLKILHYEISPANSTSRDIVTSTYYSYLTSSLLANGLPSLESLYVRDPKFADGLVCFEPPRPAFAAEGGSSAPLNSNNPFAFLSPRDRSTNGGIYGGLLRQLEVYTKDTGPDDEEWNFSCVDAVAQLRHRGSQTSLRPLSSYGLAASCGQLGPSWTGSFGRSDVRKSTLVTNGAGSFLAVPGSSDPLARPLSYSSGGQYSRPGSSRSMVRPETSAGEKKKNMYDMWR